MYFSVESRFLFHDNRVIAFNRSTGIWMKFSKECYQILEESVALNHSREQLLERFFEDEDKQYFRDLLQKLKDMNIVVLEEIKIHKNRRDIHDVTIVLTRKCNLACAHCIVDAQSIHYVDKYNTDDMKNMIDKVKLIYPKNITLTGGEPMTRKDFIEILEHTASNYYGHISLMTNGTLINKHNVKTICSNVHSVNISMDGVDEESCSIVRGQGVFDRVIRSIHLLQENGMKKISLSMVLTKNNENLINRFLSLNESLGTKPMLRSLLISGRAAENEFLLKEQQFVDDEEPPIQEKKDKKMIKGCSCAAGVNELTIEHDGNIYPCNLFVEEKYSLGNMDHFENLNSLFENMIDEGCAHSCLRSFEPDHFSPCKECNVNLFCWSCLHDLYRLEKSPRLFEDRCKYMKNKLTELVWQ